MLKNFGPDAFEQIRQDTLRRQREALADVRKETKPQADKARDRPQPRKSGQYPPTTRKEK